MTFFPKQKKNPTGSEPRSRCSADRGSSELGDPTVLPASALVLSGGLCRETHTPPSNQRQLVAHQVTAAQPQSQLHGLAKELIG